ncbi:hypothetical protein AB9K41_11420 [Cribrihabitans sp. XS_ASV171]
MAQSLSSGLAYPTAKAATEAELTDLLAGVADLGDVASALHEARQQRAMAAPGGSCQGGRDPPSATAMNTQRRLSTWGRSGRIPVCVSVNSYRATSTPAAPSVATRVSRRPS